MSKATPSITIDIEIANNTYPVKFPNIGQLIEIERGKKRMSDGYDYELASGSADSAYAKILIDMTVTFSILIPTLLKDLNVKSIYDLSLVESKPMVDVYLETYLPWYQEWVGVINKIGKDQPEIEPDVEV